MLALLRADCAGALRARSVSCMQMSKQSLQNRVQASCAPNLLVCAGHTCICLYAYLLFVEAG